MTLAVVEPTVATVLERTRDGERITDEDAVTLLRSRDLVAVGRANSDDWLDVMRHAHKLGMSTTATMMYGHVETLEERVEHMRRVLEVQDEMGGFRAFI